MWFVLLTATSSGGPELSVRNAKHSASGKLSMTTQSSLERPPGLAGLGPGLLG